MMVANDGQHAPERPQRPADGLSGDRMLLHDRPLFRGEARSLLQNVVRDRDLADVVQIAAALQGEDRVVVESDMASEAAGIGGESSAVVARVGIARLDSECERYKYGFSVLKLVRKLLELQQRRNASEEFFWIQRFTEEVVRSGFDS